MTRKCFFIEQIDPGEEFVTLRDQAAHHVESVLRSKPGDAIELRDGQGSGWRGVIENIKGRSVRIRLIEKRDFAVDTESPLELTLALAYARSDRMELVVRQATEVGVRRLVAFRAERSQYGLSGAERDKRRERWLRISREALCQCGRAMVPKLVLLQDTRAFIEEAAAMGASDGGSLKVLACEGCRYGLVSLWRATPAVRRVIAVVGPEGGWAPEEVRQFTEAGFQSVHLGPRILRLETAAVAFLSSLQLLWGDLGVQA